MARRQVKAALMAWTRSSGVRVMSSRRLPAASSSGVNGSSVASWLGRSVTGMKWPSRPRMRSPSRAASPSRWMKTTVPSACDSSWR